MLKSNGTMLHGLCSSLQLAATHCDMLHHTAAHCNTLQPTATQCCMDFAHLCNSLQHAATCCNTLHHTATHSNTLQRTATHCNTLQHTAAHCNTLQPTHTLPLCVYTHSDTHKPVLGISRLEKRVEPIPAENSGKFKAFISEGPPGRSGYIYGNKRAGKEK